MRVRQTHHQWIERRWRRASIGRVPHWSIFHHRMSTMMTTISISTSIPIPISTWMEERQREKSWDDAAGCNFWIRRGGPFPQSCQWHCCYRCCNGCWCCFDRSVIDFDCEQMSMSMSMSMTWSWCRTGRGSRWQWKSTRSAMVIVMTMVTLMMTWKSDHGSISTSISISIWFPCPATEDSRGCSSRGIDQKMFDC